MSSAQSMNARKCVHAQKPNTSQAFAHESSKIGGRGKREEERETGKTEARRLMENKAAQQNKNTSEEVKQCLPTMHFIGRVTMLFSNNSLMECLITMKFLHIFFTP